MCTCAYGKGNSFEMLRGSVLMFPRAAGAQGQVKAGCSWQRNEVAGVPRIGGRSLGILPAAADWQTASTLLATVWWMEVWPSGAGRIWKRGINLVWQGRRRRRRSAGTANANVDPLAGFRTLRRRGAILNSSDRSTCFLVHCRPLLWTTSPGVTEPTRIGGGKGLSKAAICGVLHQLPSFGFSQVKEIRAAPH